MKKSSSNISFTNEIGANKSKRGQESDYFDDNLSLRELDNEPLDEVENNKFMGISLEYDF